jgi:hypothetical protein
MALPAPQPTFDVRRSLFRSLSAALRQNQIRSESLKISRAAIRDKRLPKTAEGAILAPNYRESEESGNRLKGSTWSTN